MHVNFVAKDLLVNQIMEHTEEFTLERSHMFVNFVTRDLLQNLSLDCIEWITLAKDPSSVNHVKKLLKHQANWKGMPMFIAIHRCDTCGKNIISWKCYLLHLKKIQNALEYVTNVS